MTTDAPSAVEVAGASAERGRTGPAPRRALHIRGLEYFGLAPFLIYVGIFLLWPTYLVLVGAFQDSHGHATSANISAITSSSVYVEEFKRSLQIAALTAVIGAIAGALLTWAIAGARRGPLRPIVLAASGVLAQFGGVALAFAFIATFGFTGMFTIFLQDHFGINIFASGAWLYDVPGIELVYTYFQIPLMVIVFLPAMDGLRPQWREAAATLGGTTWTFWRRVAGPILAPAFFGATLLLFANAFSAYATAAALVSQGSPIVPLEIANLLESEVNLNHGNLGQALSVGMVVVVAIVMTLYAVLQQRTSRWLR